MMQSASTAYDAVGVDGLVDGDNVHLAFDDEDFLNHVMYLLLYVCIFQIWSASFSCKAPS